MEKFFINMAHSFIFLNCENIIDIESRKFKTPIIMSECDCVATSIELSCRGEIVKQVRSSKKKLKEWKRDQDRYLKKESPSSFAGERRRSPFAGESVCTLWISMRVKQCYVWKWNYEIILRAKLSIHMF